METVRLSRGAWKYDPKRRLGRKGGFGEVFEGVDEKGQPVAVKKLHVGQESAGHRELRIAQELAGHSHRHVIPILDSGADAGSDGYFIVMARAEYSLQSVLSARQRVSEGEAIEILIQITAGLIEIRELVHRDLKPDNILFHEDRWKLADLGIAKFVEESTSVNTLKDCLSAPYAAPEQWNLDGVTKKTDVYALGCVAHALIAGSPPFQGATWEEYRRRHLEEVPSQLPGSRRLAQLVAMCLRKTPAGRPELSSVQAQLQGALKDPLGQRHHELVSVGAVMAHEQARRETEDQKAKRAEIERRKLAREGVDALISMLKGLGDEIRAAAPVIQNIHVPYFAGFLGARSPFKASLGAGSLSCSVNFPYVEEGVFKGSGWNVVAGALIKVTQDSPGYPGRSANLWFMKMQGEESYRWWEVCYMSFGGMAPRLEPFGFEEQSGLRHADLAAAPIMHTYQCASRLVPIDGEYEEEFLQRWVSRFAQAAKNILGRPQSLPEK